MGHMKTTTTRPAADLAAFAVGQKVLVNGKPFTVAKAASGGMLNIVGSRGGAKCIVQNIKHGYLMMVGGGSWRRCDEVAVVSLLAVSA